MKTLFFTIVLAAVATAAAPPTDRVTNRENEDGSGSSKEVNPDKLNAVETFYDAARRPTHKIVYKLDQSLHPVSGIYYNNAGRVFQKSVYRTEENNRTERGKIIKDYRIVQEVVYNAKDQLICTKNFIYGARGGSSTLIGVDTYDANGNLYKPVSKGGSKRR